MLARAERGCADSSAMPGSTAEMRPRGLRGTPRPRTDRRYGWLGIDYGQYEVAQNRSCVSWVGESLEVQPEPAEAGVADNFPVEPWQSVFDGQLAPDFTIVGNWSEVIPSDHTLDRQGELTVSIDAVEVDGSSQPRLHVPAMDIHNDVWMAPATTVSERRIDTWSRTYDGDLVPVRLRWMASGLNTWAEWLTFTDEFEILGSDRPDPGAAWRSGAGRRRRCRRSAPRNPISAPRNAVHNRRCSCGTSPRRLSRTREGSPDPVVPPAF